MGLVKTSKQVNLHNGEGLSGGCLVSLVSVLLSSKEACLEVTTIV